jgi:hypothetical protein
VLLVQNDAMGIKGLKLHPHIVCTGIIPCVDIEVAENIGFPGCDQRKGRKTFFCLSQIENALILESTDLEDLVSCLVAHEKVEPAHLETITTPIIKEINFHSTPEVRTWTVIRIKPERPLSAEIEGQPEQSCCPADRYIDVDPFFDIECPLELEGLDGVKDTREIQIGMLIGVDNVSEGMVSEALLEPNLSVKEEIPSPVKSGQEWNPEITLMQVDR